MSDEKKLTPREAFTERQADFQPIVLAVPETYTPKDYLDEEITSEEDDTSSG